MAVVSDLHVPASPCSPELGPAACGTPALHGLYFFSGPAASPDSFEHAATNIGTQLGVEVKVDMVDIITT